MPSFYSECGFGAYYGFYNMAYGPESPYGLKDWFEKQKKTDNKTPFDCFSITPDQKHKSYETLIEDSGYKLLASGVSHVHSPWNTILLYGKLGNKKVPEENTFKNFRPNNQTSISKRWVSCCGIQLILAKPGCSVIKTDKTLTYDAAVYKYIELPGDVLERMKTPIEAISVVFIDENTLTPEKEKQLADANYTLQLRGADAMGVQRLYTRVNHTEKPKKVKIKNYIEVIDDGKDD